MYSLGIKEWHKEVALAQWAGNGTLRKPLVTMVKFLQVYYGIKEKAWRETG